MRKILFIFMLLFMIVGCDGNTVDYEEEEPLDYPTRDPYENACTCVEDQQKEN